MPHKKAKQAAITAETVNEELYQLGWDELRLEDIQTRMNRELDEVKSRYAIEIAGTQDCIATRADALRLAMEDSRRDLLPGKRKTLPLLFGRVGFRQQPERVALARGHTASGVAEDLAIAGHQDLIRTRQEPDKPAIKAALADGRIDAAQLRRHGVRINAASEDWWYEIARERILESIGRR